MLLAFQYLSIRTCFGCWTHNPTPCPFYVHFDSNKTEHFYSAVLLMYLQASGFDASPERLSNKGRLDLSVVHQQKVYIFELKTGPAKKAIKQIIEKTNTYKSAGAYKNKEVTLVGLQIDFTERNIVKYQTDSKADHV